MMLTGELIDAEDALALGLIAFQTPRDLKSWRFSFEILKSILVTG